MFNKLHKLAEKDAGFTLIELLIVVVVMAILVAISVPSYTRYIIISRAGEAPQVMDAMIMYAQAYSEAHGQLPNTGDNWWHNFTPDGLGSGDYFTYSYASETLTAQGNTTPFEASDTLSYDLSTKTWASNGVLAEVQPN